MTQVFDMCTLVGELTEIVLGSSQNINQPPQRLVELRQIFQWVKEIKNKMEIEKIEKEKIQSQFERLKCLPEREEILKTIDLEIQDHMLELQVDIRLGSELLVRMMDVVERNIMTLLRQISFLKNHESQLLFDINCLNQNICNLKSSTFPPFIPSVSSTLIQIQKNASLTLISQLKQQIIKLTSQLQQNTMLLEKSNLRISELQQQVLLKSERKNSRIQKQKISQLLSKQKIESQIEISDLSKNQYVIKIAKMSSNFQSISEQLTKQKNKRIQSQKKLQKLQEESKRIPIQKTQSIASQLLASNKKIKKMMNMVATYQNKTIDLELQKQALILQLSTLKSTLQQLRSLKTKSSKLTQSSKLNQSIKLAATNSNKIIDSTRPLIKHVQQKQIPVNSPTRSLNRKVTKTRIFQYDKKGSQHSDKNNQSHNVSHH